MPLGMMARACCFHKYVEIEGNIWSNELQQRRIIQELSTEGYEVKGEEYKVKD